MQFARYCEHSEANLTADQKLLNDVGTITAAINNVISQMNRTERAINDLPKDADNDQYQIIFMNVGSITPLVTHLAEEVADKKTTVLNSQGGFLTNLYDDLLAMVERFMEFCSKLFRPNYEPVRSEEVEMTGIPKKSL